jgi:broad specificity phosphatase PhoE
MREQSLRLYLARHGETDWNKEGRLQGWTDVPLNERGRAQAAELARRLADVPLGHIYVSALRRARETAAALPAHLARTVMVELNERRMGGYEGKQLDDLHPRERELFRERRFRPHDDLDGGESLTDHLRRVRRLLTMVRERHRDGHVLLVGHGATNALILTELHGRPPEQVRDLHIGNGDVFEIELATGAVSITKL